MKTVIGLDVGISTTKIVGVRDGIVISPMRVKATDPVTSLYGALGKYMSDNNLKFDDIEQLMLTGVGASYVGDKVFDLNVGKIDEFTSDALGAKQHMDIDQMIVVSMGTGTTIVKYDRGEVSHLGGIAVGGGTLSGLSRLLLGTDDAERILEMAAKGNIENVNLTIGDISKEVLPGLPLNATASLFGKAQHDASPEDVALGLICTVVQTIGSATILASLNTGIRDFFMIGSMTLLPQCREIFDMMGQLYNVRFHIPQHSEYATAIGAALSYNDTLRSNED